MDTDTPNPGPAYRPPQITFVGKLADLTQVIPPGKLVGGADGFTYLGITLGS